MITSLAWIPRGAARQRPVRFELNADEYERVKTLANEELKTMTAAGEAGDENEEEDGEEDPKLLTKLCEQTKKLDEIRNEDTRSTFPELNYIWEKYWK